MPSKANILKALGFTGLGAAAGGVGGYAAGHRTGMKRDAETPFNSQHMTLAYRKGQVDVVAALRRQMQSAGARGQTKKASSRVNKILAGAGIAGAVGSGAVGYATGKKKGLSEDAKTPYAAQHMQYAYRKGQHDIVAKLRQRMQSQKSADNVKKASAIDEMIEKLAKKKKGQGLTAGGAAKMIGIPAGIGGAVMGLMALRGKAPLGANIFRGAAGGAAVGTGLTGLIAMGQEIEKADPSGRTLKTVVELAPSILMAAGAAADLQKKANANLRTPDYIMWKRTVIPFRG